MLCACCQHDLFQIFSLLKEALVKCTESCLSCFTNANGYELLSVCIRNSTRQIFRDCIHLLTEVLKLDETEIATFREDNNLLHISAFAAEYEAVEYFEDKVPLKDKRVLENCVEFSYHDDDLKIARRENIIQLLLQKTPALIDKNPDILVWYGMHLNLIKLLVKFGADLFAVDTRSQNCAMKATVYMSPIDFYQLTQFLLENCKADYLFVDYEKWRDPLPTIITRAALLPQTLELFFKISAIDINIKDKNGENLLFPAAKGNTVNNLLQLVSRGLDHNSRGIRNRTLLHAAVKYGKLESIQYLISLKLDPNARTQNKWTSLHYAARYPQLAVVQYLVENGANVHAKNSDGQTALFLSAQNLNMEVIKYLIEKGAKVNVRDKAGNTPLHLCWKIRVIECLIASGANIHARNYKGQTALHLAAQSSKLSGKAIQYLIIKGANVNDRDKHGNTPLHLCKREYIKELLIEMGADTNAKAYNRQTAAGCWKSACSIF